MTTEAQRERETGGCHTACLEDRGRGREPRNVGASGTGNGKMQVSKGGCSQGWGTAEDRALGMSPIGRSGREEEPGREQGGAPRVGTNTFRALIQL